MNSKEILKGVKFNEFQGGLKNLMSLKVTLKALKINKFKSILKV